jgi:hypothetical protein
VLRVEPTEVCASAFLGTSYCECHVNLQLNERELHGLQILKRKFPRPILAGANFAEPPEGRASILNLVDEEKSAIC